MAPMPACGLNAFNHQELDAALNLAQHPLPNTPLPMLLAHIHHTLQRELPLTCFGAIVEEREHLVWQSTGSDGSQDPFLPVSIVAE